MMQVEVIPDVMPAGERSMMLPDGSMLHIDAAGNYRIDDSAAQVVYKANRLREFSPYVNASDMLAQFVEYVATCGVKKKDVLNLPIRLFISWLVIQAADADGDVIPADIVAPSEDRALTVLAKPRCLACNRFIPRRHVRHDFPFCNPEHAAFHLAHAP